MIKAKIILSIACRLSFWVSFSVLLALAGCKKQSVYLKRNKPQVTLGAGGAFLSATSIHLSADTVYLLTVSLSRDSGESLEIEPGTLIKVNDRISITIHRGATLQANGTVDQPIVFTSSAAKGGVGVGSGAAGGEHYWYGLRIYGNSATTGASSGGLSYMRIEFAGGNEGSLGLEDALAALHLVDIAPITTLHDIQVSYSFEVPSFEISGGSFSVKDLVSYAAVGVDFYLRQGYTGKMQNILAYRHPYFAATAGLKSSLAGLLMEDSLTLPIISNLSVLGPGPQRSASTIYSLQSGNFNSYRIADLISTTGVHFQLSNSVLLGFPYNCWYLDDRAAAMSLQAGVSGITHCYFQSDDTSHPFYLDPAVLPPYNSSDFKALVLQPENHNVFVAGFDYSGLNGALDYDTHPNPVPAAGSALLNGATFDGVFADVFFEKVSYIGAVGTESWLAKWTNFLPLQANYNQ